MRTGLKIILIVVVFILGGGIVAIIGEATGHSKGGGPIGLIIMLGLIAGCRAIWKYNPEGEQKPNSEVEKSNNDNQQLDKS